MVGTAELGLTIAGGATTINALSGGAKATVRAASRGITDYLPESGRRAGIVVSDARLAKVERYLQRHNITLVRDADVLLEAKGTASFSLTRKGTQELLVRTGVTEYELLHELIHARQFIKSGSREAYFGLGQLAREEHVFERIMNSRRLNSAERASAQDAIAEYRRALGGGSCR